MKFFLKYIFLIFSVSFITVEIILRVFHAVGKPIDYSEVEGFIKNTPNTKGFYTFGTFPTIYRKNYVINNSGYNSSINYPKFYNNKNTIALIGDSFIEGYHVDVNKSIGRLIEKLCDSIQVYEYGIGGHNIHNYIEIYESQHLERLDKVYFFIHVTDFLKDRTNKSKYFEFKEKYLRPLYELSSLVQYLNKNHKPFAIDKGLNKYISNYTQIKVNDFLSRAKNIELIYRNDQIDASLDFVEKKIKIVNHKRKPFNYGFDLHWNDNGRLNVANHIMKDLNKQVCQKVYKKR